MTIRLVHGCLCLVLFSIVLTTLSSVRAEEKGSDALREQLKVLWDSLQSIEFQSESFKLDRQGKPDLDATVILFDYAIASDNRRSSKIYFVQPDKRREFLQDVRDDGRKRIIVNRLPKRNEVVDIIAVQNLENPSAVFEKAMNEVLWLLTPAGRPLFSSIDPDTRIDSEMEGSPISKLSRVRITFLVERNRTIECRLRPDRDWLPESTRIIGSGSEDLFEVTAYQRENGRWFPSEGTHTKRRKTQQERRGFRVLKLRINREVSASNFTMPQPLEPGVIIYDGTVKKKATVVGGADARRKFLAKYDLDTKATPATGEPIVAPRHSDHSPWSAILGAASTVAFTLALILHIRQKCARES